MIVKVATSKNADGTVNWTSLYSSAIRNRLRKDLNLADIADPVEARKNLGIKNSMLDMSEDLQNILKEYIDKQDVAFFNQVKSYINNTVIPYLLSSGSGLGSKKREVIDISSISDNSFTLSKVPDSSMVIIVINGVLYFEENNDFTVNRTSSPVSVIWNTEITGFEIDNNLSGYISVFYNEKE